MLSRRPFQRQPLQQRVAVDHVAGSGPRWPRATALQAYLGIDQT